MTPYAAVLLAAWLSHAAGYNVDARNYRVFGEPDAPGPRGSYFGFSVAFFRLPDGEMRLLVGAPRANSTTSSVVEPGAIFQCFPSDPNKSRCIPWDIDNSWRINGANRDHAWLGANIQVQPTSSNYSKIAVCAPRWQYYDGYRFWMNGLCFSTADHSYNKWNTHNPLKDPRKQLVTMNGLNYFDYGMGAAGFSSHITPDKHNLFLGAPGVYSWTGSTLLMIDAARNPDAALVSDVAKNLAFTYYDHFGYSVTSGYFYNRGKLYYVSSAPRSNFLLGKVFIFSYTFGGMISIKKVFEGRQIGEFFGASLASCDINNDGRDDLVIGAPNWSNYGDEGRIYAYISTAQKSFEVQVISGEVANARFGTTVSCAGDLDLDGYKDLVVGAPYEAGHGAAYIFNGGVDGLEKRPSQVIRGSDLGARGFGIAVAGSRDRGGHYLAVGAYLSGRALLFRSRPIVALGIGLAQSKNFTLNENSTSFTFDACLDFKGRYFERYLKVNLTLKIDEFHKRVIVYQKGKLFGNTFKIETTLVDGERKCLPIQAHLKKAIQNMIDPIEISGSVGFNDDPWCRSCPVIDARKSKTSDNLKLAYALDCGSDGLCVADLYVNASSAGLGADGSFVIGSKPQVNLTVLVGNTMAPAYKAQLHVSIPEPIVLARIPTECDEQSQLNSSATVVCNVGNPLRDNKTIVIELDMRGIRYTDESKTIQVEARSQSEENDVSDNDKSLDIFYHIDADIGIVGKSDDSWYWYFEKDVREKNFQKFSFKHIYEIQKFGISPIQEVTVYAKLPTHWRGFELAKLGQLEGYIDGVVTSKCEDTSGELNSTLPMVFQNFAKQENVTSLAPPAFYVNCSDPDVKCQTLRCALGPFTKSLSVAKLSLTIDLQLSEAIAKAMEGKDTLLYASDTIARITQPNVTIDAQNKRPDYERISTTFLSRPEPEEVALWIIILSVLLGIVLLLLIALLLYKFGFFNRKGHEDLDVLKSKEEIRLKDEGIENNAVVVTENEQER